MAAAASARRGLGAAVLLLAVTACSLDYDQARVVESIPGETPDTILVDFRHTIVSEGQVWVVLEARRAETYAERKQILLFDVLFREYDSAGRPLTELEVERATFNTDSEDAAAAGTIVIYSAAEEASLRTAGDLAWTRQGKMLEGGSGQSVRLQKDDGSYVEGRGFAADFRRKTVRFGGGVRGSYVRKEDE